MSNYLFNWYRYVQQKQYLDCSRSSSWGSKRNWDWATTVSIHTLVHAPWFTLLGQIFFAVTKTSNHYQRELSFDQEYAKAGNPQESIQRHNPSHHICRHVPIVSPAKFASIRLLAMHGVQMRFWALFLSPQVFLFAIRSILPCVKMHRQDLGLCFLQFYRQLEQNRRDTHQQIYKYNARFNTVARHQSMKKHYSHYKRFAPCCLLDVVMNTGFSETLLRAVRTMKNLCLGFLFFGRERFINSRRSNKRIVRDSCARFGIYSSKEKAAISTFLWSQL